ncbi:MAG: DUF1598 domain-containing protein [Planctomycetota bacterium]
MRTLHVLKRSARLILAFTIAASMALAAESAFADGGDGGGGGGNNDGDNNFFPPVAGVDVNTAGVLKVQTVDARLDRQRMNQARMRVDANDVMRPSELRKVSLNRLEDAVAERIASGSAITDDLVATAGLTSIDYVFFYPESGDIVVAGPAEGFAADSTGRMVGISTGRPSVLLEDLIVALRAYAPESPGTPVISVSIDPTQQGLQRMQQYLASLGGRAGRGDTARLVRGLKQNLGLQTVTIAGVPPATHFARVLVEADYRMKLIGIGLEQLPLPFKGYVSRTTPQSAAGAMQRWYFQPNYNGVSVSEDRFAMRISQHGVELVGEGERVGPDGQRAANGKGNRASQAFCHEFTSKYSQIALRVRVFAELQQLIDLAIAAAYIHQQDFYSQADWSMSLLGDESKLPVQTYAAPQQVETAVNAIWRGNTLMTPLGGGVSVQPRVALRSDRIDVDADGSNAAMMKRAGPQSLPEGSWWWD